MEKVYHSAPVGNLLGESLPGHPVPFLIKLTDTLVQTIGWNLFTNIEHRAIAMISSVNRGNL
jgi:hypothetical protein